MRRSHLRFILALEPASIQPPVTHLPHLWLQCRQNQPIRKPKVHITSLSKQGFVLPLEWQGGFWQSSSALVCCLCYQKRLRCSSSVTVHIVGMSSVWYSKLPNHKLSDRFILLLDGPLFPQFSFSSFPCLIWLILLCRGLFFPLLFLLFPLCFSKLLSLSCFLFLFFASRFPSLVCCHPWLFMALQNFSAPFHLAGAQPLSIHRSFLVVVEISYRTFAPLFCLVA